jgi:uncharacterized membrane protein
MAGSAFPSPASASSRPWPSSRSSGFSDRASSPAAWSRRFDKPVLVRLSEHTEARIVGFVTQESLDRLGLPGYASVYFPQSYNFAGNLILFPSSQLEPLDAGSADVMAFIVSGGVTGVPATRSPRNTPI